MFLSIDPDSLPLLDKLMESDALVSLVLSAWSVYGDPTTVRLRSDAVCYITRQERHRWILADGTVHFIEEDDLIAFKEMDRADE